MSLILPPWQFANSVHNLTGTPPSSAPGTQFTPGSSNADGSPTEILSALAFDCHYLVVGITGTSIANSATDTLLDILTDPAGGTSYGSFIDDLVCGYLSTASAENNFGSWFHFPIYIPAGSAIAVQARQASGSASTNCRIIMYAYGNPSRPEMWWCGRKVESLGINAAASEGTEVTPGNSGADGTWTTIGTSTQRYGAIQCGIQGPDGSSLALGYYWDVGISSTVFAPAPRIFRSVSTSERGPNVGQGQPIWCDVPASTTWQMRATCSGTAEIYNSAIYGVY